MKADSIDRTAALEALAPGFAARVRHLLRDCLVAGLDVHVFEAARTEARQRWLYAQGRTRPGAVVTRLSTRLKS